MADLGAAAGVPGRGHGDQSGGDRGGAGDGPPPAPPSDGGGECVLIPVQRLLPVMVFVI